MYTAIVNGKEIRIANGVKQSSFIIGDREAEADIVALGNDTFHLLLDRRSFTIEIVSSAPDTKSFEVRVNNTRYTVQLRDRYDELLHRLGMDVAAKSKVNNLAAPMPGMVVAVHVAEGQTVGAGDLLVTLEAMKMENTLKATGDGEVTRVHVNKGQAVEKNEVLVSFS